MRWRARSGHGGPPDRRVSAGRQGPGAIADPPAAVRRDGLVRGRGLVSFDETAAGAVRVSAPVLVTVPLLNETLAPPPGRVRALKRHLVRSLRALRVAKRPDRLIQKPTPEPTGFTAAVLAAGCATCQGHCCKGGGDHAYIDERTMARVRRDNPELDARAIIRLLSGAAGAAVVSRILSVSWSVWLHAGAGVAGRIVQRVLLQWAAGLSETRAGSGPSPDRRRAEWNRAALARCCHAAEPRDDVPDRRVIAVARVGE